MPGEVELLSDIKDRGVHDKVQSINPRNYNFWHKNRRGNIILLS